MSEYYGRPMDPRNRVRALRRVAPRAALALYDLVHRKARAQDLKESERGHAFLVTSFGRFFLDLAVEPDRTFLAGDGVLEPHLTDLFGSLIDPGDVVLDIGASSGLHSVLFARLAAGGEVLAFEPVPSAWERLRRNVELNPGHLVRTYRIALADRCGPVEIHVVDPAEREQGNHSLLENEKILGVLRGKTSRLAVEARSLDAFLELERPDLDPGRVSFVKVDVEGAEHLVLRGMQALLGAAAPHLLVEAVPERLELLGLHPRDLVGLAGPGYRAFAVGPSGVLQGFDPAGPFPGRELLLVSVRRLPSFAM